MCDLHTTIALSCYLCRVTLPQCHVRLSTVADLSLLQNLLELKHRQEVQTKKKGIYRVLAEEPCEKREMHRQHCTELQGS